MKSQEDVEASRKISGWFGWKWAKRELWSTVDAATAPSVLLHYLYFSFSTCNLHVSRSGPFLPAIAFCSPFILPKLLKEGEGTGVGGQAGTAHSLGGRAGLSAAPSSWHQAQQQHSPTAARTALHSMAARTRKGWVAFAMQPNNSSAGTGEEENCGSTRQTNMQNIYIWLKEKAVAESVISTIFPNKL